VLPFVLSHHVWESNRSKRSVQRLQEIRGLKWLEETIHGALGRSNVDEVLEFNQRLLESVRQSRMESKTKTSHQDPYSAWPIDDHDGSR